MWNNMRGMFTIIECLGSVSTSPAKYRFHTSRMIIKKLCNIVDIVLDDNPGITFMVMFGNFFPSIMLRLLIFCSISNLFGFLFLFCFAVGFFEAMVSSLLLVDLLCVIFIFGDGLFCVMLVNWFGLSSWGCVFLLGWFGFLWFLFLTHFYNLIVSYVVAQC